MDRDGWNERYAGRDLLWTAEPNRFLAGEVADLTPGRALDLAAGEGRNAVWLAERGWQVTAVDFSDVGLAKGRTLAEEHGVEVDWVLADLLEYHPPERAYDLVAVLYLHVPSPDRRIVLSRAAAAVAPGGVLVVVGHDRDNLEHGHGGPDDPDVLYTVAALVDEVRELEVEVAEQVVRPVATDEGEVEALDTLVRASRPEVSGAP